MTQLSLFDIENTQYGTTVKLARETDPETSKIAAKESAKQASKIHRACAEWIAGHSESLTAREIAEQVKVAHGLNCEIETIRNRVGELEDYSDSELGVAITCGGVRRCRVTGKLAETYKVVK